jgi:uncharacterized protein (TIGR03066 family)
MRVLLSCALALVICSGVSAEDKKNEKIDAKKLVGKWEPKEKKKGTAFVVEFTKDGKVTFAGTENGKEVQAEGTYKVDGDKLTLVLKVGEMERTMIRTVSKLTDAELVSREGDRTEDTLVRVKDKK